MMNITCYNFNGADVRTVTLPNGEPGFVGKDVAERLGYADTSDAIKRHCKGSVIRLPLPTAGGMQQTRILNGDPNYHDSWHDIIGYTKLVADELQAPTDRV